MDSLTAPLIDVEPDQLSRLALLGKVRDILGPDATLEQIQNMVAFVVSGHVAINPVALEYSAQVLAAESGLHWNDKADRNMARGRATAAVTAYLMPAPQHTKNKF